MSFSGPNPRPVYPGLNALRALGALMVLATHTAFDTGRIVEGWTGAALARMDFGVAIFFVLSGFLLSRPFFQRSALGRPAPSTKQYLWKRALRILPLYWVAVAWSLLFEPGNDDKFTSVDWIQTFTLTLLYSPAVFPVGLAQMWSLVTEVAFYLALPAVCFLLLRRGGFSESRILILLGALSLGGFVWLAWAASVPGTEGHFAQWLPSYASWFSCGMGMATISVTDAIKPRNHVLHRLAKDPLGCWMAAGLIFGLAATPLCGPLTLDAPSPGEALMKNVLYAAAATLLVIPLVFGDLRNGWIRRACNHRVPHFLGEISFGIFCLHMLILKAVFRSFDLEVFTGRFTEVFLMALVLSVAAATVAHYVLERPLLRLKNWGPWGSTAPTASTSPETTSS